MRPVMTKDFVTLLALAVMWHLTSADETPIAGYTPDTDVTEHSELDLDMAKLEYHADEGFWKQAYIWYSSGNNSVKDSDTNTYRTIQGFSTDAEGKISGEPYSIYRDFWQDPAYADTFTVSACNGTGDFSGKSNAIRAEGCLKGAQYQNVWMYVIYEMQDAINDCEDGDQEANTEAVHAWDEAWAFYAGSLEGETVGGSGDGQMIYALAEKRCEDFGTCTGDDDGNDFAGVSSVNDRLLGLFEDGRDLLNEGECSAAEEVMEDIIDLMKVPLIQGMFRYFYLADPDAVGEVEDGDEGELWAFAAAILPLIDDCDSVVADMVQVNTDIVYSDNPMKDGYATVKKEVESVYSCLGIKCSDVGGYVGDDKEYYEDFGPCSDGDDSGIEDWEVAIIVIIVLAVVGVGGFFCFRRFRRSKSASSTTTVDGLGGFDKPASTL